MTTLLDQMIKRLIPSDDRQMVGVIAGTLARDIIEGHIGPGCVMNSVELAGRFETSRTPIREALFLLEKEGLVEMPQRRRAKVVRMNLAAVREIYAVRAALYALVAELIVRDASADQLTLLDQPHNDMAEAAAREDLDAYFWANVAFHEVSADICGNRTLKRILESLGLRSLQLRHVGLAQTGRMEESRADHDRLVRAYRNREGRLAAEITRFNVLGGLRAIEQSGWTG